jgi:hypothetical protein
MKFTTLVIVILTINQNQYSDQNLHGNYVSYHGFSSVSLVIRNNGTFKEVRSSCTIDFIRSGTWYLSNDTLVTCPNKFYTSKDKDTNWYEYRQAPELYLLRNAKLLHLTWKQIEDGEPFPYVDTLSKMQESYTGNEKFRHIKRKKKNRRE